MSDTLKKTFGKQKRWVNWRYMTKDGKPTKVPLGKNKMLARSNDPSTWMTLTEASLSSNIGIMALPDKKTLMVDLDNCLKDGLIVGTNAPRIEEFIKEADTYTEISPSGRGLHFFFNLSAPLTLVTSKHATNEIEKIECYTYGRYFTVTNNPFETDRPVASVTPKFALSLLAILGYPWGKDETTPLPDHVGKVTEMAFSDREILDRMFASKNGKKIEALYNGDTSMNDKDTSSADLALMNQLAFWTQKNPQQMESIWLDSPLGARKKTQTRKAYRDLTIRKAIAGTTEVYSPSKPKPAISSSTPSPTATDIEYLTHTVGKEDTIVIDLCTENIIRLLKQHPMFKARLRFDDFQKVYEICYDTKWRRLSDNDFIRIQSEIASNFPFFQKVNKHMTQDACLTVAEDNKYDSAMDYIQSLKWDGIARLDDWLHHTYGVPKDAYHIAVGSNWVKGMVKRLIDPGCKFDHVLVLEGPQGTRKSTSLSILGAGWHVETTMSTDTKDFFMQFAGKSIMEFSEGETLSRTEGKRMKAIITMQTDRYRVPFAKTTEDFPRRCVFAMTTNEEQYLKDDTGNRRWLPVKLALPEANVEWLKENRDQLLAEAHHRITVLKEGIHTFPREETAVAQQARKIQDPNTDMVVDWYWHSLDKEKRREGVTIFQVYKDVLNNGFTPKTLHRNDEMSIAVILRDGIGLVKKQVIRGGVRSMRWFWEGEEPTNLSTWYEDFVIEDKK